MEFHPLWQKLTTRFAAAACVALVIVFMVEPSKPPANPIAARQPSTAAAQMANICVKTSHAEIRDKDGKVVATETREDKVRCDTHEVVRAPDASPRKGTVTTGERLLFTGAEAIIFGIF